ncbi:unnamed protein product [Closterium sp. NIES-54]
MNSSLMVWLVNESSLNESRTPGIACWTYPPRRAPRPLTACPIPSSYAPCSPRRALLAPPCRSPCSSSVRVRAAHRRSARPAPRHRACAPCPRPSPSPPPSLNSSWPPSLTFSQVPCFTLSQAPSPPLVVRLLLPRSRHLRLLRPPHPSLHPPPPLFYPPYTSCLSSLPPPPSPPHLLQLAAGCRLLIDLPLHSTHPFTLLLLSSLPSSPPHLTLSSTSILSSPAAAGCSPYFVAVLLPHSIPLPLDSPLSISAADYSTHIPPPLVYPLSCSAADYSAHIPLPLVLPSTAQHQTTPAIFLRLLFLPSAAQQQTTPAIFLRLLFLPSAAQQQTTPAIFLRLLFLPSAAQEQTTPPLSLLLFCFPSSGPLPPPTPPPTPAPLMAPVLALPSLPLRYCLPPPITPPPLPSLPSVASVVPFPPCNTTTYCWTSLLPPRPAWLPLSHPRHTSASAMPAISTSDTGTLASIFSVTTPSQDSILGASPLMDPHFAVPFAFPVYDTVSHSPSHTAVVVSPPHTLDFVLNSGASDSIFRDASVLRSFPRPLSIQGAGDNMTMICTAASSLPCPASPSGAVTGL